MSIDQLSSRIDKIESRLTQLGVTQTPDLDAYLHRLDARLNEFDKRLTVLEELVSPIHVELPPPAVPGAIEVPLAGGELNDVVPVGNPAAHLDELQSLDSDGQLTDGSDQAVAEFGDAEAAFDDFPIASAPQTASDANTETLSGLAD